jgi:hypothetical protein
MLYRKRAMLLWVSIVAAILSGLGVINFGSLHWVGDLVALAFAAALFVAICATEAQSE